MAWRAGEPGCPSSPRSRPPGPRLVTPHMTLLAVRNIHTGLEMAASGTSGAVAGAAVAAGARPLAHGRNAASMVAGDRLPTGTARPPIRNSSSSSSSGSLARHGPSCSRCRWRQCICCPSNLKRRPRPGLLPPLARAGRRWWVQAGRPSNSRAGGTQQHPWQPPAAATCSR